MASKSGSYDSLCNVLKSGTGPYFSKCIIPKCNPRLLSTTATFGFKIGI